MNESIKKKIMAKKYACRSFHATKKNYDTYLKLQTITKKLPEMILKRKEDYYRLLSDKLTCTTCVTCNTYTLIDHIF